MLFERLERVFDPRRTLLIQSLIEMLLHDADLATFQRRIEAADIVTKRMIEAGRVTFIETGHDGEQHGGIFGSSRNNAGLIQAGGKRDHAVAGDPAVCRLQANGIRQGSGLPYRTAGIGARRGWRQASGNRRRGAARRSAGGTFRVPGVPNRSEITGLV